MASLWHHRHATLPVNSEIEVARSVAGVPVMLRIRPSFLVLTALGGALGTAARFGLTSISPSWETLSAGTVIVNLVGPFLLGVLLQFLSEGTASKRRRAMQLLIGVGFLGAFTSYAQLAVDTVTVSEHGHLLLAVAYALITIVAGAAAAWLGIVTASHRRRNPHR
ncbi:MAG: CrcB family protein [Microbacteriaceae bacterium]